MKKLRRILSGILALAMISTLMLSNVIADETNTSVMEAGSTYSYDFKTLDTGINIAENGTYTTSDGLLNISTNESGKVTYNTGGHGIAVNGTNGSAEIEFSVEGNAVISIDRCLYTQAQTPITVSATAGNITSSIESTVSEDGETGVITYTGGEADISVTIPAVSYIHSISVMVEAERLYSGEVWDFGAVSAVDGVSHDMISVSDLINAFTENNGHQGTMLGKTYSFGDVAYTAAANDRFFSGTAGLENINYGTWSSSVASFDDGYTSNGCLYGNGSGGVNRRYITVNNCRTGDLITVYMGVSADTTLHFTNGAYDKTVDVTGTDMYSFVCPSAGSYKLYVDTTNSAKPYYYRVRRAETVNVAGIITNDYADDTTVTTVNFKNTETEDVTSAAVSGDGSYNVRLQPGYSYVASIGNTGYAINNENNVVNVPYSNDAYTNGVVFNTNVITQELSTLSGTYPTDADINVTAIKFVPVDSTLETINAVLNNGSYSADLVSGETYNIDVTASPDYELSSGATVNITENSVINITMSAKAVYNVSGNFYSLNDFPESNTAVSGVTEISFVHSDGSIYSVDVTGTAYSINLRDGEYTIELDSSHNTLSHVSVNGSAVTKNVYVDDREPVTPAASSTVYVGPEREYKTISDALEAVSSLETSENNRATIIIDAGTYREQLNIDTPYVTLKSASGQKDVTVTWYYGIDYKYYSLDENGFYDKALDADKYSKNECTRNWGTTVYVGADGFMAENIVFENSFNRYFTDEEFADGVELENTNSTNNAQLVRTADLPDSYARRKDGTKTDNAIERAAAIVIRADKTEYKNCSFLSSQDTVFTGGAGQRAYFNDCYIEGMTDYIFGDADNYVVFDDCQLAWAGYTNSAAGGYITATRGNYLFRNCTILDAEADYALMQTAGYFGRPWGANASVIFLNTNIEDSGIVSEGWSEMSGVQPDEETVTFKHYGSMKDGASFDTSADYDKLTDEEYAEISDSTYLGNWVPEYYETVQANVIDEEEITESVTEETSESTTEEITEAVTDEEAEETTEIVTEDNDENNGEDAVVYEGSENTDDVTDSSNENVNSTEEVSENTESTDISVQETI